MHALNQHANVVAEHFAEQFIDESGIRLGAQRVANLRLRHGEGGLNERALVVLLEECLEMQIIDVVELVP